MKTLLFVIAIFFTSLLTGCSSKDPDPDRLRSQCTLEDIQAPRWVCGLHHDPNHFIGVGSAQKSRLGIGFSREAALADARANLAKKIELDVEARSRRLLQSTGARKNENITRAVSEISTQSAHVGLRNSEQVAYWENPKNGEIYVLVKVPKKSIFNIMHTKVSHADSSSEPGEVLERSKTFDTPSN